MPPKTVSKRTRTGKSVASSSNPATAAPPHYDPDVFVSVETAKEYIKIMKKAVHPERGFQLTPGHYPAIENIITRHGWGRFLEQSTLVVMPVVREFYANASQSIVPKHVCQATSSSTTPRPSTGSIAFAMFRLLPSMTKRPRTWITTSIVVPYVWQVRSATKRVTSNRYSMLAHSMP